MASFAIGSAAWLRLQRDGVFDQRPPVPVAPPRSQGTRGTGRVRGAGEPCTYCKRDMVPFTATHPTRDHVVPKSKGGRETVPCCTKCNNAKGDMMPHEWERFMQRFPDWWRAPGALSSKRHAIILERAYETLQATPTAVPRAYDDPMAQAAFKAVYAARLHMLRSDPPDA